MKIVQTTVPAVPDATRVEQPIKLDIKAPQELQEKRGIDIKFIPQVTIPGTRFEKGVATPIDNNTIGRYISDVYKFGVWAGGILAVIMIIIAGYRWLRARGETGKIMKAKDSIRRALVGLVFIVFAYVILVNIDDRLVEFNGLGLNPVELVLMEIPKPPPPGGWKAWTGDNVTQYDVLLSRATQKNGLDCTLLKSIMLVESGGNPSARSGAGACGLMQVVPSSSNIRSISCDLLISNPVIAIEAGVKVFEYFKKYTCPNQSCGDGSGKAKNCFGPTQDVSSFKYVIAAYNGGSLANCANRDCRDNGTQTRWECPVNRGGYEETFNYVSRVMETYKLLREKNFGC